MRRQFGYFFLVIGLIVAVIALVSFQTDTKAYSLCCAGSALVALGSFLMIRFRPPSEPSGRFNLWKKITKKK